MLWNTCCYIMTVDMAFGSFLLTLCALTSCHVMHPGRPVEPVCNRKGTTWYENHVVRVWQSVQSESRVEPWIRSQSEALGRLWRYGLQGGASVGTPCSRKKIWGKKSPLWVYVSPSISQTYNKLCAPFENKMRAIYFYKEVCFVSLIEVRSLSLITFLVGSIWSIQQCILIQDLNPGSWVQLILQ